MSTRQRLILGAAFVWVLSFSTTDVSAYDRQTLLDYNGQIFGFSTTWKDEWDDDVVYSECQEWIWDPEWEEWYCASAFMWEYFTLTRAWLYGPEGLYFYASSEHRYQSGVNVNAFTPDGPGTWRLDGNHYKKEYTYHNSGNGWERIYVNEYLLYQTSATVTITPPNTCVPNLQWPLRYHTFAFTSNPLWSGFANTVRDAALEWRNFIWNYTSTAAFIERLPNTLTFEINSGFSGTTTWGQTSTSQDVIWLNPDIFEHSYSFARGVAMHEMGHARGYAHVSPSACPVTDSIMWGAASPTGLYPEQFGPGDSLAASRDIQ